MYPAMTVNRFKLFDKIWKSNCVKLPNDENNLWNFLIDIVVSFDSLKFEPRLRDYWCPVSYNKEEDNWSADEILFLENAFLNSNRKHF